MAPAIYVVPLTSLRYICFQYVFHLPAAVNKESPRERTAKYKTLILLRLKSRGLKIEASQHMSLQLRSLPNVAATGSGEENPLVGPLRVAFTHVVGACRQFLG